MRLMRLTIEGYKCFADRTDFDFTINGGDPGRNVFLIGGMNGAGKTSVMEAVNICLYGEKEAVIFERISRSALSQGKANCHFEVQFDMGDGEVVTLHRQWTAASGTTARASDLEHSVSMHGAKGPTESEDDFLEFVLQHIPPSITQFFFFDGEKIQDMADDEKFEGRLRTSMEEALGIEIVRKLAEDIKNLRRQERRSGSAISDEDINLKENELTALRRKLEKHQQTLQDTDDDIKELIQERDEAEERFESLFGFRPDDRTKIDEFERRRSRLQKQCNDTEDEIRKCVSGNLAIALMGGHFGALEQRIEQERSGERSLLEGYAPQLAEFVVAKLLDKSDAWLRPTVGREAAREEMERAVAEAVREFSRSEGGDREWALNYAPDERARVAERLREVAVSGVGPLRPLLEQRRKCAEELAGIERQLETFRPSQSRAEQMHELLRQIRTCEQHIGNKRSERDSLEREHREIGESIKRTENELEILYQQHETSREQAAFLHQCGAVEALLEDYVDRLRKSRITQLQQKTLEMYRRLATRADSISDIRIDPDTHRISILDHSGNVIQKRNLSAGEKEVFAISLLWGLAQTSELSLPIIIDTPLSRLDSKHRDAIVRHYFPQAGPQVIVLSTDTEVDQKYYELLQPHLQYSVRLHADRETRTTVIEPGYFPWRPE